MANTVSSRLATKNPKPASRRDPRARHTDGVLPYMRLANKDPNKHYVLAYANDRTTGVEYYEAIGYTIETYRGEQGVHFPAQRRSAKLQEPIENRGHYLMSIPLKDYEEIQQYGPEGGRGQDYVDQLEHQIVDTGKALVADGLRGLSSRRINNDYYSVQNENSSLQPE